MEEETETWEHPRKYLSKVYFFRCTVKAIWIDKKDKGGNSDMVSRPQIPSYTRISQVCIVKTIQKFGFKNPLNHLLTI